MLEPKRGASGTAPADRESSSAAWSVVAAVGAVLGFGVTSIWWSTFGLFFAPLEQAFGWSRSQVTLGILAMTLLSPLLAPIGGYLIDRVRTRPLVAVSLLVQALFLLALGRMQGNIWFFYAVCTLIVLPSYPTSVFIVGKILNEWFDRRRGTAIGAALTASSLGAVTLPLIVQALVSWGGWRVAFMGLAVLTLAVPLPAALFGIRRPGTDAASASARAEMPFVAAPAPVLSGHTVGEALRDPAFWWMGTYMALFGLAVTTVYVHLVPLGMERGLSAGQAAGAQSLMGLGVLMGNLIGGTLLDRFHAPRVALAGLAPPLAAALAFAFGGGVFMSFLIAAVFGLANGNQFVVLTYMVGRYFGQMSFARIFSFLGILLGLAAAAGPWTAAFVHDRRGSYQFALVGVAVAFGLAMLPLLKLGKYRY